jgi:flagellar assembly protein FliH
MQLQSDAAGPAGAGPAPVLSATRTSRPVARVFGNEGKGVARLEFESVEDPEANGARVGSRPEMALKEEVAVLREQLRVQTEALPGKLEEAKRLARLLAHKEMEQETEQRVAEDRAMVRKACEEFERERTRYFAAVEAQVVKLALAIAARVLHREAKMDPLLLSGAVRVALEKVNEESETRLKVPAHEAGLWTALFEAEGAGNVRVIGEEGMARGECVLETSVGTVELGIEAQLGEIERGFFDLMQKRPA